MGDSALCGHSTGIECHTDGLFLPRGQLAPPKSKYIEHILVATHTGEAGVAEIFRTLEIRLRESGWTVVFKSLIVLHMMIREGQLDATLQYVAENPRKIAISGYSEGETITDSGRKEDILMQRMLQCKRKDTTFGDIPITSFHVREHLRRPRQTTCGVDKAG